MNGYTTRDASSTLAATLPALIGALPPPDVPMIAVAGFRTSDGSVLARRYSASVTDVARDARECLDQSPGADSVAAVTYGFDDTVEAMWQVSDALSDAGMDTLVVISATGTDPGDQWVDSLGNIGDMIDPRTTDRALTALHDDGYALRAPDPHRFTTAQPDVVPAPTFDLARWEVGDADTLSDAAVLSAALDSADNLAATATLAESLAASGDDALLGRFIRAAAHLRGTARGRALLTGGLAAQARGDVATCWEFEFAAAREGYADSERHLRRIRATSPAAARHLIRTLSGGGL